MDFLAIRDFFMWCSILNVVLLLISFIFFWMLRDKAYKFHSKMVSISREQFDVTVYNIFGLYKIGIFLFNVVPFVALLIMGCCRQV